MFKEENMILKGYGVLKFFLGASYLRRCRKILIPRIDDDIRYTDASFEYRLEIVDLAKHHLPNKS